MRNAALTEKCGILQNMKNYLIYLFYKIFIFKNG